MEITLLAVGRTGSPYLREGIREYCGRLAHYVPFSLEEIPDVRNTRKLTSRQQKDAEGKGILARLSPSDMVILLDERGEELSSLQFASRMERDLSSGRKRLVFVIGGPYGFSDEVYARADRKISLSKMTFSHEMVRLFFTEQLYRAMTILRGEPYHHQ